MRSGPKFLSIIGIPAALLLLLASDALAQPNIVATFPPNNESRVPINAVLVFVFDRPTAKSAAYSVADLTSGGAGLITTAPDRWSALGDTLYITPLEPLAFGRLYGMKLNLLQDADSSYYGNPTYYDQVYYFTTLSRASVERVQAGNLNLTLTPDVTLPVTIPVRERAGTDVSFMSVRVQFLPSAIVANADPDPLDLSVTPLYEYTLPLSVLLPRFGFAGLTAPVTLPSSIARTIPQGMLGVRLTFYGTDETSSPVVVDVGFRVDPASVALHQGSVLPAMASDVLVRSATLEWPVHGAVIAAGDTVLPRAVVTGNGTGPFRAAFYVDGDLISIEEGYMEAGRPVTITMRGPLPTRRLGEHRLQFQVEAPQPFAANPISFICAAPPSGLEPPGPMTPVLPPVTLRPLRGTLTWIAEGGTPYRGQDASAVGWGAWNGVYELSPTRRIEAVASMRLRFDDVGNGNAKPQHLMLRYSTPRASVEWSDLAPRSAIETPLLMSPVPRRSAQAALRGTPLGDLEGYVALASHPISAAGPHHEPESDLYAARLGRSWLQNKVRTTAYAGYTHEDLTSGGVQIGAARRVIYGGVGTFDLPGTWSLLADAATVRHRKTDGIEEGRSRTGWRGEVRGTTAGFEALAQGFSYQPSLETALNPYALSDRRGGYARLARAIWKWNVFGSFRSEEPASREGLMPIVRVQTGTFGGRLELNQESWVTPSLIVVRHEGANTDFRERRLATEYTAAEPLGGRTTARFDIAFLDDPMRALTKRRVISGSIVSTRRHPGRVVSTMALGLEQNHSRGLNLTDTTIQGSFEARWEAAVGRILVMPFVAASSRDYKLLGSREERYSGRVQVAFLRVAGLGENALSLEGRVDRSNRFDSGPSDLDGSVQITIGQRFGIGGVR